MLIFYSASYIAQQWHWFTLVQFYVCVCCMPKEDIVKPPPFQPMTRGSIRLWSHPQRRFVGEVLSHHKVRTKNQIQQNQEAKGEFKANRRRLRLRLLRKQESSHSRPRLHHHRSQRILWRSQLLLQMRIMWMEGVEQHLPHHAPCPQQ